jgi:hypothetical protein
MNLFGTKFVLSDVSINKKDENIRKNKSNTRSGIGMELSPVSAFGKHGCVDQTSVRWCS